MNKLGAGCKANPLILLTFTALVFFPSCEWFKPARDTEKEKVYTEDDLEDMQGTKVFDPETGEWRVVREVVGQVDTIVWKNLEEEKFPPITSDGTWTDNNTGNDGVPAGGDYDVSMVLPFLADYAVGDEINRNSYWAIHFYAGAKMAYDDLARDGVNMHVQVFDSDAAESKINRLLQREELKNSKMIVGPYKRDNVDLMADFSKLNKIPLIVPFTAQSGMTTDNPYYIQVNPSLKSHSEAIIRHALKRYRPEEIVLVVRNRPEEIARLDYFQDANAIISGTQDTSELTEFVVDDASVDYQELNIDPYIREGQTTVFIVPSWSSEPFVYSMLRQLRIKQAAGEEVIVYGMPQWMDYEQVDVEFLHNLHVKVSSASYIDDSDERIRQFKKKYFEKYGTIPLEESYLGYDVMLYFGKMLHKYGSDFPARIDSNPFDVLHGRFEFSRVVNEPELHLEELDYYDQLENKFVHILEFRDFHFQPAY